MSAQQDIIDRLIDYIDKAILKNSVSNRHVASVLAFLNERLKAYDNKYLRKDQADATDYQLDVGGLTSKGLIEANNGLIVRKTEVVEPVITSLIEENEDALVEELYTNLETTLGKLCNVDNDVDSSPIGSLFIKGKNWHSIPPVLEECSDFNNMLMPVYHKILGRWVFISVSAISGGVAPPTILELVLDTGLLDVNKLA